MYEIMRIPYFITEHKKITLWIYCCLLASSNMIQFQNMKSEDVSNRELPQIKGMGKISKLNFSAWKNIF